MPRCLLLLTLLTAAAAQPLLAAEPAPRPAAAAKAPAAATGKGKAPAAKAPARKPAAPAAAKAAPPPPPLPAAGGEQLAAAALAHYGDYACEREQTLNVDTDRSNDGYVLLRFGKQSWTLKPILSGTGALRLEDVGGRVLLLQIADKSMLMDVAAGRRLVDDCVHAKQVAAREAGPPASARGLLAAAAELRLRILETTDLHMHLPKDDTQDKSSDQDGLAKTATLIRAARAESANSLYFDSGDLLQGSAPGDFVARVEPPAAGAPHPAYEALHALGIDAGNVGGHEFSHGLPFMRQAIAGAGFPIVNANVHVDDGDGNPENDLHAFTPYVILERSFTDTAGATHALKVGVIGFVPPQIQHGDRTHLLGNVTVRDIVATAQRLVPEMKAKGADIVVAIPNAGFEQGETPQFAENTVARLAGVPGVDAILSSHSHAGFPGRDAARQPKVDIANDTINGVPPVTAGRRGEHLGVIDLVLDNSSGSWKVRDSRAELRPALDSSTRQPLVDANPSLPSVPLGDGSALYELRP